MTNREALILSLRIMQPDEKAAYDAAYEAPLDDPWPWAESNQAYWVSCPHHSSSGHPCDGLDYPWSTLTVCGPCIDAWLDEEVSE